MRIVLASQSPRRRQLLAEILPRFEVIPSVSEESSNSTDPQEYVKDLACNKAKEVFASNGDALVIGCDTVVVLDGKVLGKPRDPAQATAMLRALSGRTHQVYTGVCILGKDFSSIFCECTQVTFKNLTEQEIAAYVATGSPLDKAGAYGIQDCGFVESFSGSYNNVMGLPTQRIAQVLQNIR